MTVHRRSRAALESSNVNMTPSGNTAEAKLQPVTADSTFRISLGERRLRWGSHSRARVRASASWLSAKGMAILQAHAPLDPSHLAAESA
jgi:hypothetical protein